MTHSFLVIPECPIPLLGQDLLTKMGAHIYFTPQGPDVITEGSKPGTMVLTLSLANEHQLLETKAPALTVQQQQKWLGVFPEAWAETAGLGLATQVPPVVVDLKATAVPILVQQYPMSREDREGISPYINCLFHLGVLHPYQSLWNMPLLPVKKPGTGDFRPVQDLREVNKRVQDFHPTVPNPYNLLSSLLPDRQ